MSNKQNLYDWVEAEINREGSPMAEFVELFTVEFILDNLDAKNQNLFLTKIAHQEEGAMAFACSQIHNFEERFSSSLQERIFSLLDEKEEIND